MAGIVFVQARLREIPSLTEGLTDSIPGSGFMAAEET